jgi:hypothetical protein
MVFDACRNAAFSLSESFPSVFARASSDNGLRDVAEANISPLDVVGLGEADGSGEGKGGVCCADGRRGRGGTAGGSREVVSDANNARTRLCTRARFRIIQ